MLDMIDTEDLQDLMTRPRALRQWIRSVQKSMPIPDWGDPNKIAASVAAKLLGISRYKLYDIVRYGDNTGYSGPKIEPHQQAPYVVQYFWLPDILAYKRHLDKLNGTYSPSDASDEDDEDY